MARVKRLGELTKEEIDEFFEVLQQEYIYEPCSEVITMYSHLTPKHAIKHIRRDYYKYGICPYSEYFED